MPTNIVKPLQWWDYNRDDPIASGFKLLVPMWENTGSQAQDIAGGHEGTFSGTTWATGLNGPVTRYAGSESINYGNSTELNMADTLSFGGWIFKDADARMTPFGKGFDEYDFYIEGGGENTISLFFGDGTDFSSLTWQGNGLNGDVPLFQGNWRHICFTLTKSTGMGRLYIDGTEHLDGVNSTTARGAGGTKDFEIGRRSGGGNSFTGDIDQVFVADRIYSDSEIQQLYNDRYALLRPTPMPIPVGAAAAVGIEAFKYYYDQQEAAA